MTTDFFNLFDNDDDTDPTASVFEIAWVGCCEMEFRIRRPGSGTPVAMTVNVMDFVSLAMQVEVAAEAAFAEAEADDAPDWEAPA